MKFSNFKEISKQWNCFSATDTLGSFDFYTTIVSLDSLTLPEIRIAKEKLSEFYQHSLQDPNTLLDENSYHPIAKVFPLAVHEYTHFIDATSTIWGLNYLKIMKESYESNNVRGGRESDFHKAKKHYDFIRKLRLPEYYTLREPNTLNVRPWRYKLTTGLLFDQQGNPSDRAVAFTQFMNAKNEFLVRSPISMVALLEMSAMAQEVLMNIFLLMSTNTEFQSIEGSQYSNVLMEYLYNPDITEYSVCVHLVANLLSLEDPALAFRVCAVLSRIILNVPINYFSRLSESCPIQNILRLHENDNAVQYFRNGLSSCDYGTLFYLMCHALPKGNYESAQAIQSSVEASISELGINLEEMQSDMTREAQDLCQQIVTSKIPEIQQLAKAGYQNFLKIKANNPRITLEQLNLPPVLLSDSEYLSIFPNANNLLSTFNIDSAFEELYSKGQAWVERFSEACV
ncbi:hypothetical protein [Synechococcus elongatus]|uniref:Uncharacterized protein n=1 Tax=Synechococcus elongatus PCC 11801 TaxID=2219813 RepID=A0AAN1QML2_SYNEL|nr:hypothetical protein [Synechococcus elongatus]